MNPSLLPEKKRISVYCCPDDPDKIYNQSLTDTAAHFDKAVKELITVEEIQEKILDSHFNRLINLSGSVCHDPMLPYDTPQRKLAVSIHAYIMSKLGVQERKGEG